MRLARGFAITALALFAFPTHADSSKILNLGVFAFRPPAVLEARYQPLADYLSAQLVNVEVRLLVLSQDEIEQALEEKRLDLLFTNPSHYVLLRSQNALTGALATLISMESGQPANQLGGVIIAHADRPPPESFAQLRNCAIASSASPAPSFSAVTRHRPSNCSRPVCICPTMSA